MGGAACAKGGVAAGANGSQPDAQHLHQMPPYRAPRWLPGGNLQTIWPALMSHSYRGERPRFERERWATPDGDFIDVDFAPAPAEVPARAGSAAALSGGAVHASMSAPSNPAAPLLVLFHGLEGSSASHYALALAHGARQRGMGLAVPHFRGCSGELNHAPRAYHSGDHEEIAWILQRLRQRTQQPLWVVGVSLGGNALLRWAQEAGATAAATTAAVVSISAPLDLTASGRAIGQGFNRQVYTRMFLRSMKPKALAKLAQHPGLFDRERLLAARTLHEFDDVFTGPVHGFKGVEDYWLRASAKPHLGRIKVPALVINALNDPFVPAHSLPRDVAANPWVRLWQPEQGGHVGFASGAPPGQVFTLADTAIDWIALHAGDAVAKSPAPGGPAGA